MPVTAVGGRPQSLNSNDPGQPLHSSDAVASPAIAVPNVAESKQRFATPGIQPITRPSLTARFFMKVVSLVERLNLKCATLGNPPVYDNSVFPWSQEIEDAYPAIRAELEHILKRQSELPAFHEISTDVKTISTDNKWKTFFLVGFGVKSEENIRSCPKTWKAVQKIPGLNTALFSILEPGKHLPPHRGPYNGVLRLHLGLIVPDTSDKLAIRIENKVCHWKEGKVLIFDDAYEHEAWNHTNETRVVLFVDFVKPMSLPGSFFNWLLMNLAVFTPFIKEGLDNHKEWEKRFYTEAQTMGASES